MPNLRAAPAPARQTNYRFRPKRTRRRRASRAQSLAPNDPRSRAFKSPFAHDGARSRARGNPLKLPATARLPPDRARPNLAVVRHRLTIHPSPRARRSDPPQAQADNRHTIILVQPTGAKTSRTFLDYEKVSLAMDGARALPSGLVAPRPAAPRDRREKKYQAPSLTTKPKRTRTTIREIR